MLVLTRKNNDQIRIADDITVTVLRIKGNTVRLGIEAPANVRILRGELPDHGAAEPTEEGSMIIIEGTLEVPELNADENPGGFIAESKASSGESLGPQGRPPLAAYRERHGLAHKLIETKTTLKTAMPEIPVTERMSIPFSPRPSQPR